MSWSKSNLDEVLSTNEDFAQHLEGKGETTLDRLSINTLIKSQMLYPLSNRPRCNLIVKKN